MCLVANILCFCLKHKTNKYSAEVQNCEGTINFNLITDLNYSQDSKHLCHGHKSYNWAMCYKFPEIYILIDQIIALFGQNLVAP
jgi:hypothetical protein